MTMKKPLVSVIIPVYKTEQYLDECMDSVLRQDYPDVEIILVDDGSPDNCPALCDRYEAQYAHVHVIHQNNRGLGLARNAGMAAASGVYLFFLDSDDRLDGTQALSRLVQKAQERQADIVIGGFRRFDADTVSSVNPPHLQDDDDARTVSFRFQGFYRYGHLSYQWGKLYRKRFLEEHDLKCRPYPFTQDKAFNMACCAYEPVYAFIKESVCLYRMNDASVTYRYKKNFIPVWVAIASDFHAFLQERQIPDRYGDLTAFHIFFGSFFLVKQELQYKKHGIRESVRMLRRYGRIPFVRAAMTALAKGKYVSRIDVLPWKIMIRAASILFTLHLYLPFTWGIDLLRRLQVDAKITARRYQNANEPTEH